MKRQIPTTARIAILATILSLLGNAVLIGFIRFATFDEHEGLAEALERSLWLALALAIFFGLVSGVLIARFVGRRVEDIARVADAVAAGNLTERAPVSNSNDAFDHMASRLNAMLDRIEALMAELRVLTDSLAHDLRSPVQRLRARIEQALTTTDDAQRDQLLSGVLAEADALTRILSTVLEIGRSEAMTARNQFAPLDPAALIVELVDMYEPLAEERGVALASQSGPVGHFTGHRQLLAQALSNLIDNALNYGGGAPVTVFANRVENSLLIGVADGGPGIPEANIEEALRRFGRLDIARSTPGAGLGLSLVAAVAHLHRGELRLTDYGPGLHALLILPA